MGGVRPLWLAGCAVLLLAVCGVAGASATNSSDREHRVPYTDLELVLDGHSTRAVAPGTALGVHPASAAPTTPAGPVVPTEGAAARSGLGFAAAVTSLAVRGEMPAASATADVAAWSTARVEIRHLQGTRKAELGSVVNTLQAIAHSGGLTPARLPELILTLQRNTQWWSSGPLLTYAQRVGFPGSNLVWEYYPGQGIQIQWLGTFGAANGFYDQHDGTDLAGLLSEALSLAVARGGGIAWEYDFAFDGGRPPWVSAITQGTAIEALVSAAGLLHDTAYLTDAHEALGIFNAPPPVGVEQTAQGGSWYLIYSFAPHDYVINAFIQALIGLYDLAYAGDPAAQQAFQRGNSAAELALPGYNTGAWSMYDQYGESTLSYHELLTGFLRTLCKQESSTATQSLWVLGAPAPSASTGSSGTSAGTGTSGTNGTGGTAAGQTGPSGASGTSGSSGTTGSSGASGPSGPTGASGSSGSSGTTGATGPAAVYCETAVAFTAELKQPPKITIPPPRRLRVHHLAKLSFTLSKVSNVSFAVTFNGTSTTVASNFVPHGTHYFVWRPSRAGTYTITLDATDLAGNRGSQTASVTVAG